MTSEVSESPEELFSLEGQRYDLNTYVGRTRHFFNIFNPLLLLTSTPQLEQARGLLNEFESGKIDHSDVARDPHLNNRLWKARTMKEAMIHPQTDEKILAPFRMSAFVPMNMPTAAGMLLSKSLYSQLFWQFFNQSYNVGVNHANGNKSNPMPPSKIATAYGLAVSVSMGMVYGLNGVMKQMRSSGRYSPGTLKLFGVVIPYSAVATAGACNCIFMRANEIWEGIDVVDEHGHRVGKSKKAGQIAVFQTAFSRVVLPIPILFFPGIVMRQLESTRFVMARPHLRMPLNIGTILFFLWVALPSACGLFPQTASVHVNRLEPDLAKKDVGMVYFNRGL